MDTEAVIKKYFSEMKEVIDKISRKDINEIVEVLFRAWKNDRHVYIMGNGGSASTATHFMCDLMKTTVVESKKRVKATALVDNIPLVSALTNDCGFSEIYIEQLKNVFNRGDVVIAISVHGGSGSDKAGLWSQNLLKALQYAKDNGGVAIGLAGFDGGAMKKLADYCLVVPANSTPQVESLHAAITHLICLCLKNRIESEQ